MTTSLSRLLERAQLITQQQVRDAETLRTREGHTFAHAVSELGFLEEEALVAFVQNKLKIPAVRAGRLPSIPAAVTSLISAAVALHHRILPVAVDDAGHLTVAMADPTSDAAIEAIRDDWRGYLIRAVAPPSALDTALERHFGPMPRRTTPPAAPAQAPTPTPAPAQPQPQPQGSSTPPHADPLPVDEAAATMASTTESGRRARAATRWNPTLSRPQRAALPLSMEAVEQCISQIKAARDREALVERLMDFVEAGFDQTLLFVHSRGTLRGMDARGRDVDREAVRSVRLDSESPSIFRTAIDRMIPLFGPMPRVEAVDRALAQALGGVHGNVLVLPIVVEHRVPLVCFAHGTRFSVQSRAIDLLCDEVSDRILALIDDARRGG